MGRLRYLEQADLAPEHQDIPRLTSNITRAVAHSPLLARLVAARGMYFRHQSGLNPRLRELAILQVAHLSASRYEWTQHVPIAESFGATPAQIEAIGRDLAEPEGLGADGCAVLGFTREVIVDGAASERSLADLTARLGERQVVELLLVVGNYMGLARLIATVGLEPQEPVVKLPGGADALGPG